MFKLMGKEINAILGAQNVLIWTHGRVNKIRWLVIFQNLTKLLKIRSPVDGGRYLEAT